MNAIPTTFAGRRYRSRLEARWAAFFTLLEWPFEYEPLDFNGWIPDFVLMGARRVFVEVKPVEIFPENISDEVDRSGCEDEILIVGTTMLRSDEFTLPSIGWLGELWPDESGCADWNSLNVLGDVPDPKRNPYPRLWQSAVIGSWVGSEKGDPLNELDRRRLCKPGNPNRMLGFCGELGHWRDRITGYYDGGCYGQHGDQADRIFRMWQEAGNIVQWKGRNAA